MVTASALLARVYLFGTQLAGRIAGLVAVGALLLQPRFFFHAHLACFDVPITALWFWVIYSYWQSFDSRRWAIATGVLFGVALSVKLNAFFLPIVLVGHWALMNVRRFGFEQTEDGPSLVLPPIPKAFWAMAALGPLLFYILWPRHWFNTFARVRWYMNFHLEHEHYFVNFFGQNLQIPPFPVSYPTVMTLVTVPATILVAMAIGAIFYFQKSGQLARYREIFDALRARRFPPRSKWIDPRGTGLLLLINIVFPILLISMPNTPIFGGTKHWMPAMPFAAILAGFGVVAVARALRPTIVAYLPGQHRLGNALFPILLAAAVLVPAAYATSYNHPHGTAYYNEFIGSYRGAADQEMFRQFWGYASRDALPWVNEEAPENTRIWVHNTIRMSWRAYLEEEIARPDLRSSSMRRSDYALYHQQKAFVYQQLPLWEEYRTMAPAHVIAIDDVPLLSVYVRQDPSELKYPDVWR